VGGGKPIGVHAEGDGGEVADIDSRSGLRQKLEVTRSSGSCCTAGSATSATGKGRGHYSDSNFKCRNDDCKKFHTSGKLPVAVVGPLDSNVIYDAASSGNDNERECRHIGIRHNFPFNERYIGSSRSIAVESGP